MQTFEDKVASLNHIRHSIESQWSCLRSSLEDSGDMRKLLVQDNQSCCMLDSLKASYVLEQSAIQNGVQMIQARRNKC